MEAWICKERWTWKQSSSCTCARIFFSTHAVWICLMNLTFQFWYTCICLLHRMIGWIWKYWCNSCNFMFRLMHIHDSVNDMHNFYLVIFQSCESWIPSYFKSFMALSFIIRSSKILEKKRDNVVLLIWVCVVGKTTVACLHGDSRTKKISSGTLSFHHMRWSQSYNTRNNLYLYLYQSEA